MGGYSLRDVSRILNVSAARVRYWKRTALLAPPGAGTGGASFGFGDLVSIRSALRLIDQGVPLRRIRQSVETLRARIPEIDRPLGALRVWGGRRPRIVVRHGDALFEPDGQMLLDFDGVAAESRAVEPLRSALQDAARDRDAALVWFERGCRLDSRPETYVAASDAYRRAIEADPGFADAHCNLGTVFYNQGRAKAAEAAFRAALASEPGHLEAHFNLANVLEDANRNEAALGHLRAVVRIDPCYADGHLNLALLYEKLGLGRRARGPWRRYLGLVPRGYWSEIARGRLEP